MTDHSPTDVEICQAVLDFCSALDKRKCESADKLRPGLLNGKWARRKVGTLLIQRYREETGAVGAIDWEKFREWLDEHMAEVNFAKLLISVLLLFL